MHRTALLVLAAGLLTACAPAVPASTPPAGAPISATAAAPTEQRFPDIVEVQVSRSGAEFSFAVTVSSPYDTPQRYADGFRVRSADGTVFGVTELTHDHATEQPFTRTLTGVAIPPGVDTVVVEGRDQAHGWGGGTMIVALPG